MNGHCKTCKCFELELVHKSKVNYDAKDAYAIFANNCKVRVFFNRAAKHWIVAEFDYSDYCRETRIV